MPTNSAPDILEVPSIGLTAPVLQGIDEAVFAVAVGHDPASVWPGNKGTSVLLAHDVGYFSDLASARIGGAVIWIDRCVEARFRIVSHEVTRPGAVIAPPRGGIGLSLVTCWPTDALFWTPDRYVVNAVLVSEEHVGLPAPAAPALASARLQVPAPAALRAKGLAIGQSEVLAGRLSITGSPSRSFLEGRGPLEAANAGFAAYAAAQKTAAAGDRRWWADLATAGVPLPASWALEGLADVIVNVRGGTVSALAIDTPAVTVAFVVRHATLYVTSVTRRSGPAETPPVH